MEKYILTIERALDKAKKDGASMAEAYLTKDRHLFIEVRNNIVETMKFSENMGVGVRVIVDQRIGFAFSSDISGEGVKDAFCRALYNASQTFQLPGNGSLRPGN